LKFDNFFENLIINSISIILNFQSFLKNSNLLKLKFKGWY